MITIIIRIIIKVPNGLVLIWKRMLYVLQVQLNKFAV